MSPNTQLEPFSTRITPARRAQVKIAAAALGESVQQFVDLALAERLSTVIDVHGLEA